MYEGDGGLEERVDAGAPAFSGVVNLKVTLWKGLHLGHQLSNAVVISTVEQPARARTVEKIFAASPGLRSLVVK